jgi:hypothetical protein
MTFYVVTVFAYRAKENEESRVHTTAITNCRIRATVLALSTAESIRNIKNKTMKARDIKCVYIAHGQGDQVVVLGHPEGQEIDVDRSAYGFEESKWGDRWVIQVDDVDDDSVYIG